MPFSAYEVLYSQNLLICQNEYCIAVIKAWLPRRDSGFFILRSPRRKFFKRFFEKMMRFRIEICTLFMKALEKLFWEVQDVGIKYSTFLKKGIKTDNFKCDYSWKARKTLKKPLNYEKIKNLQITCRKTVHLGCLLDEGQ